MIDWEEIKKYYFREDVINFLLEFGKDREIVAVYEGGNFGKRPDILQYPRDIINYVENRAISFHCSVERWKDPMLLEAGLTKTQLDENRKAWDLVIDLDVSDFEIAKIATLCFIEALEDHGVKSYFIKYTGGKSFHIIVFFESFPEVVNGIPLEKQYPEVLQKILLYLKWYTKEMIKEELLAFETPLEIAKRIGKKYEEIIDEKGLNPFKIISLDIFGSRHLIRMPYALHENSLRISLPLKKSEIMKFKKEDAEIKNFKGVNEEFLRKIKKDGSSLLIQALDWCSRNEVELIKKIEIPKEIKSRKKVKLPVETFPPCIKNILAGLNDGRKRAIFIIITFLRNVGWSWEEIEKALDEWNSRNKPPLRENYIRTQLRWHVRQERTLLPPNCDHQVFYKDMGVCTNCRFKEDSIGYGIKNPLTYAFRKFKKLRKATSS